MEKQHPYKQEGFGEGNPGSINPSENGRVEPAKRVEAVEHLDINESGFGRDQGHTPAEEHIDTSFSQIDDESKWMYEQHDDAMEQTLAKQFDTDDFKRVDERDNQNSAEDWNAERSRTGRHK